MSRDSVRFRASGLAEDADGLAPFEQAAGSEPAQSFDTVSLFIDAGA